MSRQFSIPTVLRMAPNRLLKQFFHRLGHSDGEIPWEELKERETRPVVQWLSQLPSGEQIQIEGELRNVFDLACESGWNALIEGAIRCGDLRLAEDVPEQLNFYGKAMWARLERAEAFDKALLIHQLEHLSWWRRRNDLPRMPPDASTRALEKLQDEISGLLTIQQGRGRYCTVETFERAGTWYFFAHPDDFAQSAVAHDDEGRLAPFTYRRTFEIVFAFDPNEGTLELHAPRMPAKLKRELEAIFARTLLKHKLGPWNPDPAYELDHLKDRDFRLETDPADRLVVRIRKMRLKARNSGRRILIEVDEDDDIHTAIDECLNQERLPLSAVWVDQVTFCFELLPMDGRKPGRATFDVTWPNSCSLRSQRAERVELVRKYLKRWGIDRARAAEPDPAKSRA